MIGLDTNVLVRYITQDDPVQAALATDFIEQHLSSHNPGIISHIVLCETAWVLSRAYHYAHEQVAETLNAILTCQEFVVESDRSPLTPCEGRDEGKKRLHLTDKTQPTDTNTPDSDPHTHCQSGSQSASTSLSG